jgi:hypothetical protein
LDAMGLVSCEGVCVGEGHSGVCGLESLVRSCRSSLADGLWVVDGFQGPGWVRRETRLASHRS